MASKQTKIEGILEALISVCKKTDLKIYVTLKNKDEYLTKYKGKQLFTVRSFPKGQPSKKKLETKEPLAFFLTLKDIVKVHIVNDKLNKDKSITLCVFQKRS